MRDDEVIVNGVKVSNGRASADVRQVPLPSGKTASIRKGFGRDLMRAQRVAGPAGDSAAVIFALIAELTEVDGERIVYEDLLAMELNDVLALQAEVAGPNFQDPPPPPSPRSSILDSR